MRDQAAPNVRRVPTQVAGRELIFAGEDGTYAARTDGSRLRKLFDLEGIWEFQADVSPDGRLVALRSDDEGPRLGTWLVGIDGRNPVHLSRKAGVRGGAADWSPDGRFVVYTGKRDMDSFLGLWVVPVDGSSARRITPDTWEAQYPAWSPDGELIAFTKVVPPDEFQLYVVRPDGSGLRRLTRSESNDNYAAWAPDSRRLVFSSEGHDHPGLWIVNADGSGRRFLTDGGEPQWEPGPWIIFDCPERPDAPARGCVIAPDASGRTTLPIGREVAFPNWLP